MDDSEHSRSAGDPVRDDLINVSLHTAGQEM